MPKVSHSVVQEALDSAAEFITGDALKQQALAERQSIVLNELRTVIAIPLRTRQLALLQPMWMACCIWTAALFPMIFPA